MPRIKLIALDVLKPHLPAVQDFATALAELGPDYRVELEVVEVDEHTQTTLITLQAQDLDLERIEAVIRSLGGSVHSVDRVVVTGTDAA